MHWGSLAVASNPVNDICHRAGSHLRSAEFHSVRAVGKISLAIATMIAHLLCLGLLLWAVVAHLFRRRAERRLERARGCEPIARWYPHLDVFGGLDLTLQVWREFRSGELSEGMRRRHNRCGSTFMARDLGSNCIYTIEPRNIRTVTTTNFEHWGKSAWVGEAAKHVGNGVLLNEGEAWKRSRNLLRPIFARTVADTPASLEPHLQRLIATMREKQGEAFDFQRLAGVFVLDVTTEFLFGQPTNCLASGEGAQDALHFLSLVKQFEPPSAMFMAVGALAWLQLLPNYRALIQCVNGMKSFFRRKLDSIIASSKTPSWPESRSVPPNVFRMMKAQGIPREQIQGELQNIFFASYDTTTALLSNLVELVARNTGVQQRLREEVATCLGGRRATSRDLLKMEYLQCVVSEGECRERASPRRRRGEACLRAR